jgi:hypothetical protein
MKKYFIYTEGQEYAEKLFSLHTLLHCDSMVYPFNVFLPKEVCFVGLFFLIRGDQC